MEALTQLIVLGFLVEALVETFKPLLDRDAGSKYRLLALGISVPVSGLVGVDAFQMAGFELGVPYVGALLTGVIISRGANYLHDLVSRLASAQSGDGA